MACLSPSPSGRRLSELLEEKQEPFVLDLHLLEKGCSSRLLDGYDTALCWHAAGNDAAAAVLRRLTSKKNKSANKKKPPQQPAGGGLLRLLLSKILRGRPAPPKPAALQFSDSFKMAVVAPPPAPSPVKTAAGDAAATECGCFYSDDGDYSYSDDEKQQLSPVSVLEPHPFEMSSPAHRHGGGGKVSPSRSAAMDVFRELLDAAYSPALLTQLLAKTDDLVNVNDAAAAVADDEDDYYYGGAGGGCRSSPKSFRDEESAAAYWDAHGAELARVSELVAAEIAASKVAAGGVEPERQDVGGEVEAAVFEALVTELVADLWSGCRC